MPMGRRIFRYRHRDIFRADRESPPASISTAAFFGRRRIRESHQHYQRSLHVPVLAAANSKGPLWCYSPLAGVQRPSRTWRGRARQRLGPVIEMFAATSDGVMSGAKNGLFDQSGGRCSSDRQPPPPIRIASAIRPLVLGGHLTQSARQRQILTGVKRRQINRWRFRRSRWRRSRAANRGPHPASSAAEIAAATAIRDYRTQHRWLPALDTHRVLRPRRHYSPAHPTSQREHPGTSGSYTSCPLVPSFPIGGRPNRSFRAGLSKTDGPLLRRRCGFRR